jgi:2-polyprenyl-3-methyl-5-hydroxy-6-metoxy-1,4-benzoquinol methylase
MGPPRQDYYRDLHFSAEDRAQNQYREHLGGGNEQWERRGRFQVHFLSRMGMTPQHRLIDIGCGPIRAGVHFINYLDPGNYYGIDYNPDFIEIAREISNSQPALAAKQPTLRVIQDFRFEEIGQCFDFVMVFSVIQHSTNELATTFFRKLAPILHAGSRVYITHARWFRGIIEGTNLQLLRMFSRPEEVEPGLDMSSWGWENPLEIYPILEIGRLA